MENENKTCRRCKKEFPATLEFFRSNKSSKDKLGVCLKCLKHYNDSRRWEKSKWRRENPEGTFNNSMRVRKVNINWTQYQQMFERQHGLCAICHKPETAEFGGVCGRGIKRLAVDHDHNTGKIRGLLCQRCNNGIGQMDDNPDRLRAAAAYLEASR
jgi:hypothetical protein